MLALCDRFGEVEADEVVQFGDVDPAGDDRLVAVPVAPRLDVQAEQGQLVLRVAGVRAVEKPVRAGLCSRPSNWAAVSSSARASSTSISPL